jgi:hypothetical protein
MRWTMSLLKCDSCGCLIDTDDCPDAYFEGEGLEMKAENRRTLNFLCGSPSYGTTTVETADLREILLETGGNVMARGRLYNLKSELLGAGVYKLSLEIANP